MKYQYFFIIYLSKKELDATQGARLASNYVII
jgi:hypothetical protein